MIGQTAIKNNKKYNHGGDVTALYARLSKDDALVGDSNSIVHQDGICQGGSLQKLQIIQ